MPDKYSDDYKSIIEFVALQLLRTKSMVDIINKVMGGFTNTLKTEFPDEINLLVDSLNKDIQNPVLISLQLMGVIMNSISDLSHQLFYLGPKHELVTSDTPVVKYNLYNQAIQQRGLTGTQNKGITLFIPLSPKYLLVLYDSNVYTLSKDVGPENITVKDVEAINFLQFVFCDENVYFRSAVPVDKLKRYAKKARIFRKAEQPITEIFEEVENKNSSLIVQRVITPNLQLALSFIRVKKSARKVSYKNRINDMYRGELPDLTEKFSRPEHPVIFREKKKKTV